MKEKFQKIFNLYSNPDISSQLDSLVVQRERVNGLLITRFYGGPLDLGHFGLYSSWLYSFEVKSKPGSYSLLNFDVIEIRDFQEGSIDLDLTPDDYYKLCLKNPKELFDNKRMVIRLNPNQLYFPVFPDRRGDFNLEGFKKRLFGFLNYLGVDQYPTDEEMVNYLNWYNLGDIEKLRRTGQFYIRERNLDGFSVWDVLDGSFSTSFPFFQIFRKGKISFSNGMEIRVDSGCQIGQVYDDGGCDCRSQFLKALDDGDVLFHLPHQDGRGWGMLSKMKTEELKREMDTVEAARRFFEGIPYDIRDYAVIGIFFRDLGIGEITLQTDNKRKIEALENAGIKVSRKPTETLNHCNHRGCFHHIEAKHNTSDYFSS
jgi:GTP cyclohydrolase II